MLRAFCLSAAFAVLGAASALAEPGQGARTGQASPQVEAYRDDRSTPVALIESLYNAVNRHEYLRAWSYFSEAPDFETFEEGYRATKSVRLKLGEAVSEGAAGSIYSRVPTVIEASGTNGALAVFTGCYETRLVQPANQATPPFKPLQIVKATLRPASTSFAETLGDCSANGT